MQSGAKAHVETVQAARELENLGPKMGEIDPDSTDASV
jgi:hypothetical protein